MNRRNKTQSAAPSGFSLLELLAVVTILGIIAVVAIPRIGAQGQFAKKNACHQYRSDLNSALERYYFNTGSHATTLSDLEAPVEYYPGPVPNCPLDNVPYTIDPTTHRIFGHNH